MCVRVNVCMRLCVCACVRVCVCVCVSDPFLNQIITLLLYPPVNVSSTFSHLPSLQFLSLPKLNAFAEFSASIGLEV